MTDARDRRRIRILWNCKAGTKGGLSTNSCTPDEMRDLMSRYELGDELVATESEEEAIASAREAVAAGYSAVVAAGGDGTVGTVATQLLDTDVALGILPLGSAMNIARSLEIPRDLEAAAEIIRAGHVRAMDVGEANGRVFYEGGSIGMNAAIFREGQRLDRGEYGGLVGLLRVVVRYRPARVWLRLDDRVVRTRGLMVTVANGPYTGMGFTLAPDARLDDGLFDIRVWRHFSKWELVRHFLSIAFGRRAYSPHMRTFRSSRVTVSSRRPLPTRVDSTHLGTTPVRFTTRKGALRVLAPSGQP